MLVKGLVSSFVFYKERESHPVITQVVAMLDGSARFTDENVDYASFVAATGVKDGQDGDLE